MGIFEHFPYSNFHNLNLDRILERTKEAEAAIATTQAALDAAAADMAAASAAADSAVNIANQALTSFNSEVDALTFRLTWDGGELAYTSIALLNIPQGVDLYRRILQSRLAAVAQLDTTQGSLENFVAPIHYKTTSAGLTCYFIVNDLIHNTFGGVDKWAFDGNYVCMFDITSSNAISNVSIRTIE